MEIEGDSLDALLVELYGKLNNGANRNVGTRGETLEQLGVILRLAKPRARLSRSEDRGKPFSALGEFLWYLSGSNSLDFIESYVPMYRKEAEPDGTVHGAYGPRLLNMRAGINQFSSVIELLRERSGSRRAVIQIFNAEDIATHHKEVPCTTTLQFFVRNDHLSMAVTMRSNDAYKGLPHDVFCFTMIQEMVARALGVCLGEYIHFVGSMHLYESDLAKAAHYLKEGHQRVVEMPPMPLGDQFPVVPLLVEFEEKLRNGEIVDANVTFDSDYWADIARLLQVFWLSGKPERIDEVMEKISNKHYTVFAENRKGVPERQTLGRV
ncbi:thymidylate synthase [Prosthecodimorpha staleyi]|uniref:thymidylate synthase n=1 Tax=Prosthecodimorpha staleyi TaxID=2840188 RepID=A0A947D3M6_9HYPH|nr:thymidylate synthase [Prosthecodimorpha staleyi]MBT9290398.1 thymidylate synthase [Prosthecodimorpha staleyi]